MSDVTDPVYELTKLLDELVEASDLSGSAFLAQRFGVEEWSLEFYQIIFSIIQRIESIRNIISGMESFGHLINQINPHLSALKNGFTAKALQNAWKSYGFNYIKKENIQPVRMCSAFVRGQISYPELSDEECADVLSIATSLLGWLREHQIEEDDFIRQALIEGVENFIFRMEHLQWLGWGYSLESLKAVIMAYVALQRGNYSDENFPNLGAAIKKIGGALKQVFEIVGIGKDITERADFALKAYGALDLAYKTHVGISGFLPGP
jgi:hypothetical protein